MMPKGTVFYIKQELSSTVGPFVKTFDAVTLDQLRDGSLTWHSLGFVDVLTGATGVAEVAHSKADVAIAELSDLADIMTRLKDAMKWIAEQQVKPKLAEAATKVP